LGIAHSGKRRSVEGELWKAMDSEQAEKGLD
jgi:hypothetical protein